MIKQKAMPALMMLVTAYGLASCRESDDRSSTPITPVEWVTLKDGSFLARQDYGTDEKTIMSEVARCWAAGDGYDCLAINRIYADAGHLTKGELILNVKLLPDDGDLNSAEDNGYSCTGVPAGVSEAIGGSNRTLQTRLASMEGPWSKSYVNRFMSDNEVPGRWFNCVEALRIVDRGSMKSIGTTLVTRQMAIGR